MIKNKTILFWKKKKKKKKKIKILNSELRNNKFTTYPLSICEIKTLSQLTL